MNIDIDDIKAFSQASLSHAGTIIPYQQINHEDKGIYQIQFFTFATFTEMNEYNLPDNININGHVIVLVLYGFHLHKEIKRTKMSKSKIDC